MNGISTTSTAMRRMSRLDDPIDPAWRSWWTLPGSPNICK
jgi:hypothetical protein